MDRFACTKTPIEGLRVIERRVMSDNLGFHSRLFCWEDERTISWNKPIVQINHTLTRQTATVRGLHFQYPPHAEMKLVSCIRGQIWNVAVDLRAKSPTFLCITLPWNIAQEVIQQNSILAKRGTRFVIAVPKMEII
jgi:dTDP-4-dehydrorhamnose 3,5-epimerase